MTMVFITVIPAIFFMVGALYLNVHDVYPESVHQKETRRERMIKEIGEQMKVHDV